MSTERPMIIIESNGKVVCEGVYCTSKKMYEKILCGNCEGRKCPMTNIVRNVSMGVAFVLSESFNEMAHNIVKTFDDGTTDISEQQEH